MPDPSLRYPSPPRSTHPLNPPTHPPLSLLYRHAHALPVPCLPKPVRSCTWQHQPAIHPRQVLRASADVGAARRAGTRLAGAGSLPALTVLGA